MKQQGADIVAYAALDEFIEYLEKVVMQLTKRAMLFSEHAKRKTIQKKDVSLVIKFGCFYPNKKCKNYDNDK